jgi:2-keto-4-pentenoate hydratase/2-oxohepta-3-ene-1,7-dioic acid hydratase in catechol pathway
MRYCHFDRDGRAEYGLIESVAGRETITHLLAGAPEHVGIDRAAAKRIDPIELAEVRLLAPVNPSKIACVGRNYGKHAAEMGQPLPKEPLIFLKPPSAIIAAGDKIVRPKLSQHTDYEGELGVIIGKRCYKLSSDADVRPYILGYTVVNDFTARDLQRSDTQWTRGKGFDTFCPVGPIVTDELDPWAGVAVQTRVNGELRQDGNTHDFIFSLDVVIRFISQFMTLLPGDLIATGTPDGVSPVVAGDVIEVTVEGVGTLRNPVVDE